jgi:hypothetical protein
MEQLASQLADAKKVTLPPLGNTAVIHTRRRAGRRPAPYGALPPPRRNGLVWALGGAALMAAAAVGFISLRQRPQVAVAAQTPPPVAARGRSSRAGQRAAGLRRAAAKPIAETVTLKITSTPPGADVYRALDGIKLGQTPLEQTLPRSSGLAVFVLKLSGHRDMRVELPAGAGQRRRCGPRKRSRGKSRVSDDAALDRSHDEAGGRRALIVALAAPAMVEAQPKKPSRKVMKEARAHFEKARCCNQMGAFDEAIREYETAYELAKLPDLLTTSARSTGSRASGRPRCATTPSTSRRRRRPRSPEGARVPEGSQARDGSAGPRAAPDGRRRDRGYGAGGGADPGDHRAGPAAGGHPAAPGQGDRGSRRHPAHGRPGERRRRVVVLGAGVFFGLHGLSLKQDLDDLGPGDEFDPSVVDDGTPPTQRPHLLRRRRLRPGDGGVLYYLGTRRKVERTITVAPSLTPDGASLRVAGEF